MVRFTVAAALTGPEPTMGTRAAAATARPSAILRMPPPGVEESEPMLAERELRPIGAVILPRPGPRGQEPGGRGGSAQVGEGAGQQGGAVVPGVEPGRELHAGEGPAQVEALGHAAAHLG